MIRALVVCAALGAGAAHADEPVSSVPLPLTLLDAPEAFVSPYHFPTWEQSLDVTGDVFRAGHLGIHYGFASLSRAWWSVLLETASIAVFDLLMSFLPLPLTTGWLHEEGHRAAMGVVGVPSEQVFDNFALPPERQCDDGSVCGMTDLQISTVKGRRAADWVRVQAAGMETELELMRRLEREAFFTKQPRAMNIPVSALLLVSVELYRAACADAAGFTEDLVKAESANQLQRDFTGPDCTGFAVDLFRPNEPYEARGPHPNGDGLRRVRLGSDLTGAEHEFLVRMRNLGFLNFVDPALFGFPRFEVKLADDRTFAFGASLQHDLTAFGDALGLSLRGELDAFQLTALIRVYRNQVLNLPGLTVGLRRYPVKLGPLALRVSGQVELWLQPKDFLYATTEVIPGGALELQGALPVVGPLEVFAALRFKTAGWRPVDPYLDASVSGRVGLNLLMPVL